VLHSAVAVPATRPPAHNFVRRPHRTILGLSLPVLLALVAEPLTGLADTAFIARLGATEMASLGVATVLLSSILWVFNFLTIGTQTEVARLHGSDHADGAGRLTSLALMVALGLGILLLATGWPLAPLLCKAVGAEAEVLAGSVAYLRLRLLGAPAVLLTLGCFGSLRGLQDMRTPLFVSLVLHASNIALDAALIFGLGPFPRLELEGAAWATTAAQWTGAALAVAATHRRLGLVVAFDLVEARRLFVVGRDLFARTGLLLAFSLVAARVATLAGEQTAAAHQATRQIWIFTAFALDALAATAQTLVGYFRGGGQMALARRVAALTCAWGLAGGIALAIVLALTRDLFAAALVPPAATAAFVAAWPVVVLSQPLNAVSFVTDGIHWGTADYTYLRNAMLLATAVGLAALAGVNPASPSALRSIWLATALWIVARSGLGLVRIWPGIGHAPLRPTR
jgi:MATE family multidrug resistance protein